MQEPIQPPVSFEDFTFALDPALPNIFPSPPPLPSSADLFSPSETTDLLGFLDGFGAWDFEPGALATHLEAQHEDRSPDEDAHMAHHGAPLTLQSALVMSMSDTGNGKGKGVARDNAAPPEPRSQPARTTRASRRSSAATVASTSSSSPSASTPDAEKDGKPKQLLSTPQKRLNHIMSEQKRRNAIRDGYVQLTALLAPAGAPPGAGMPTRGRPKGSGSRAGGRGRGGGGFKGKSGILFRAVEYIQWLEEGRDALLEEVLKVEAAAGIHHPS